MGHGSHHVGGRVSDPGAGMISSLSGDLLALIITATAAVLGLGVYGARQRFKGREAERNSAEERDHDKADDIRDRVERDLPDRLRRYDDAGYRD